MQNDTAQATLCTCVTAYEPLHTLPSPFLVRPPKIGQRESRGFSRISNFPHPTLHWRLRLERARGMVLQPLDRRLRGCGGVDPATNCPTEPPKQNQLWRSEKRRTRAPWAYIRICCLKPSFFRRIESLDS